MADFFNTHPRIARQKDGRTRMLYNSKMVDAEYDWSTDDNQDQGIFTMLAKQLGLGTENRFEH